MKLSVCILISLISAFCPGWMSRCRGRRAWPRSRTGSRLEPRWPEPAPPNHSSHHERILQHDAPLLGAIPRTRIPRRPLILCQLQKIGFVPQNSCLIAISLS